MNRTLTYRIVPAAVTTLLNVFAVILPAAANLSLPATSNCLIDYQTSEPFRC